MLRNRLAFAALGILAAATAANAATITQTHTFGDASPNFSSTLTFDKFTGPGTLTGIDIEVGIHVSGGSFGVDNDGADPAIVTVHLGATGAITSADVHLLNANSDPVTADADAETSATYTLAGDNGDGVGNVDTTSPDGELLIGGNNSDVKSGLVGAQYWSQYIGAGTFRIVARANQVFDDGSLGGVEGSFSPVTAGGYVTVTYTTSVPVPASAVAGIPLLGLLAGVRAMKKRNA